MESAKETVKEAVEAPKEMSKRALEKARKKAEKAQKKQEHALRPKPAAPTSSEPTSIFAEGWLKKVYETKPVPVRTRFPPEPNGFLHIGHAKAIAVNFGFAKHYNGICLLRYDDTNPAKEDEIYFTSIKEMVEWLGFEPHAITHSSDYFDKLYELGEELIRRDKGYVCHCTREEMNLQRGGPDNRGPRFACAHRSRPIEESLAEFRAMKEGKYKPGEATMRMKQSIDDPNEGNPQMWDLAAYRVVEKAHHARTGDAWKIYPTYDFTHCLCDAFENISHSLCTTEFQQSRISYDWLLQVLDYKIPGSEEKGPMQREYGRLNVQGTILSKRRIAMLVEGAKVEKKLPDGTTETVTIPPAVRGWDDPRLYTLVAIRRRGVPAKALLEFVEGLGVTDALTDIQVLRFESAIRRHLERTVPRLMLILDPIRVTIADLAPEDIREINIPYDPKGSIPGSRAVPFSATIYIDRSDFREEDSAEFFRLAPNKVVGLLNAFPIKAVSFSKDPATGKVTDIAAVKAPEGEKPKAYIHWVDAATGVPVTARQYNPLFLSDSPNSLDWKGTGWAEALNPNSEVVWADAVIERGVEELIRAKGVGAHGGKIEGKSDELVRFQALRTGYFCVDVASEHSAEGVGEKSEEAKAGRIVLNQIVTLKEDKGK